MGLLKILNAFHAWSNSLVSSRFPGFSLYYYTKPRSFLHRRKHPVHRLLRGQGSVAAGDKKSVLFFSVHKSATSFMSGYLGELAKEAGLAHIDYNGYFIGQGQAGLEKQKEPGILRRVFQPAGYLYGPLRYYLDVPGIDDYPVVLFLRDPRDVLTSQYFSVKHSHPLNTKRMIERRKAAQHSTIDEHVRSQAGRFLATYSAYIDKLLGKKNVLFLKYEDMIADFPSFLEKINVHSGLGLSDAQKKKLDRTPAFTPGVENVASHRRKVVAGDHKEKLQPETIAWLNETFAHVLDRLDYPR